MQMTFAGKWGAPIVSFTCLLILWEAAARFSGWSASVFPGPDAVFAGLVELGADGTLLRHAVASLYRVTAGFYLAVILGVPLGILLGRWRLASIFLTPLVHFLRPISPLAWIPLAMLWFGIGDPPAVFLIFLASFFPMVVSTTSAVQRIPALYYQVAANFNFNRREIITRVVLPAIVPDVVIALRISITIAWLVVVAAEMIAVQSGLGYLILDARNALRMDHVMVGMLLIGMIGISLDTIMKRMGQTRSLA